MIRLGVYVGRKPAVAPVVNDSPYGPRKLTQAQVDEARQLYAAGSKLKALAREFDVSPEVLRYWLKKAAA